MIMIMSKIKSEPVMALLFSLPNIAPNGYAPQNSPRYGPRAAYSMNSKHGATP